MLDTQKILSQIPYAVEKIDFRPLGKRFSGKVRDWFIRDHLRILIATDRISAFDKVLGLIPFRGAVLTKLSQFHFDATRDIIQNHMIGVIDPNVMLVSQVQALPIEIVVRGYITGVTDTSLWKRYSQGERTIYGIKFPEGLKKNQKLKKAIITPTTRGTGKDGHDEPITPQEVIKQKIMNPALWKKIEKVALALFDRGSKIYDRAGFILADTKYEFGLDRNGKLILIDEVHTPDSSRIWVKKSYKEKFKKEAEVENYDKEIMRLWFANHGYTGHGKPPEIPKDLVVKIAKRYIEVCEKVTNNKFDIDLKTPPMERITSNLSKLT